MGTMKTLAIELNQLHAKLSQALAQAIRLIDESGHMEYRREMYRETGRIESTSISRAYLLLDDCEAYSQEIAELLSGGNRGH